VTALNGALDPALIQRAYEIALRRIADYREPMTDDEHEVLGAIEKQWKVPRFIRHDESGPCALRAAIGRPCSCDLGCRCPHAGCKDPVTLGETPKHLAIYGETGFERVLKEHRASWRFGHYLEMADQLAYVIDAYEDPWTVSYENAARHIDRWIEEDNDGTGDDLREDLEETWKRFALALAREHRIKLEGDDPLKHRCLSVLGASIPRNKWPRDTGIYAVRANDRLKIGWGKNIAKRLTGQQTFCPYPLELVAYVRGASVKDEKALHKRLSGSRLTGEWFAIDRQVIEVVAHMTNEPRGDA
jgi:hypothetical protein